MRRNYWITLLGSLMAVLSACGTGPPATSVVTEEADVPSVSSPEPSPTILITEEPILTEEPEATEPPEEQGGDDLTITQADSSLGLILVDPAGSSLYLFLNDNQGESTCYGGCAQTWPPVMVEGDVVASEALDAALIGVTTREDGSSQVTYNGWPLYYYFGDASPGDTNGQGLGGVWYLVSATGEARQDGVGGDDDRY